MKRPGAVVLAIVLATVIAYLPALQADFVDLDDPLYILQNRIVRAGLTLEGVRWAFTTTRGALWIPLSWLSHMLDVQLFGLAPVGHHLTGLLLHLANSALVFFVLRRLTGADARSGFVAALFALHPLRVESVAWIAERKDVLSTFFLLLAVWTYVTFVRRPTAAAYGATIVCYALALLAKPMVVTLPAALLLLDHWPLGRPERVGRRIAEKLPLMVMALATLGAAMWAGAAGDAVADRHAWPLTARLVNAATSCVVYLRRVFWPTDLAAYYPLPRAWPATQLATTVVVLSGISAAAVALARRRPYLLVGWLWFLGTLLPALGIVQAGSQGMADRFTYVPLLGVFIALTWAAADVLEWARVPGAVVATGAAALLVAQVGATWRQAGYWTSSTALFERTLAVTDDNWFIHDHLGSVLLRRGRAPEATAHFEEAIRIEPRYARAHAHLGAAMIAVGRLDDGIARYEQALEIDPAFTDARNDLGLAYLRAGRTADAVRELTRTVGERPDAPAHFNLGLALERQGDRGAALGEYTEALRLDAALQPARERRDAAMAGLAASAGSRPPGSTTTQR